MSTIFALLTKYGGPMAMGYILPRVTQRLGETLWGRLLLFVARRRIGKSGSPHQTLIDKLARDAALTEEQLSKLTPAERDLLMHSREVP